MTTHTYDRLPATLKDTDAFVLYRIERDAEGKTRKVPYSPYGHRTSPTVSLDPAHPGKCYTYADAMAAYATGQYDGIGITLYRELRLTCIDLDRCRDIHTGTLTPFARDIIARVGSWSEVSVSGTGIHIFGYCDADLIGTSAIVAGDKIEIYQRDHYIALTGNHLTGTPHEITDCTDAIVTIHAEYIAAAKPAIPAPATEAPRRFAPRTGASIDIVVVIDKARTARNGDKFRRLYDQGDTSMHGGNPSKATLSLCRILAFWCRGDRSLIDRAFRQSALMRGKWDEARGATTWGDNLISDAVEATTNVY